MKIVKLLLSLSLLCIINTSILSQSIIADAYVRAGGDAAANFGSAISLKVRYSTDDSDDDFKSFIKIDVSSLTNQVASAKLKLYVVSAQSYSDDNPSVLVNLHTVSNTNWAENTITWNNSLSYALSPVVSSLNIVGKTGQFVEFDITSAINKAILNNQSAITIVLLPEQDANKSYKTEFSSKEKSTVSMRPSIVITNNTNTAPVLIQSIQNQALTSNSSAVSINLSNYFSDTSGDVITYTYTSNPSTSVVSLSGNTLTINPTQVGTYSVTVNATDNSGATTSTTFQVVVTQNSSFIDGKLCIEAENGQKSNFSPMLEVSDVSASNSKYILLPNSVSGNSDNVPTNGHITYTFNLDQAATIYPWFRVICPDKLSDSFWVRFDGGTYYHWSPEVDYYFSEWLWQPLNSISLSAGQHTLEIAYRENGTQLDKILFTLQSNAVPQGSGCDVIIEEPEPENVFVSGTPLCIEAERGEKTNMSPMLVVDEATASNQEYIYLPTSASSSTSSVPSDGHVIYRINLTQAATIYPWFRVICPDKYSDSFWVRFDGGAFYHWSPEIVTYFTDWLWQPLQAVSLSAGEHILEVVYREKGTKLDKIMFTDFAMGTPVGSDCSFLSSDFEGEYEVDIEVPATTVCDGVQLPFKAIVSGYDGVVNYKWESSTATFLCPNCKETSAVISEDAIVSLTVSVGSYSKTKVLSIDVVDGISVVAPEKICKGQAVQVNGVGTDKYIWSPINYFSCQGCSDPLVTEVHQTTNFAVSSGIIYGGCQFNQNFTIQVSETPEIILTKNEYTVKEGTVIQPNVTLNHSEGVTVKWQPEIGLSNSNIVSPTINASSSTLYQISAVNETGCVDNEDLMVNVVEFPNYFPSTYNVVKGENLFILHEGVDRITWEPSTNITSSGTTYTTLTPLKNETYIVTVKKGDFEKTYTVQVNVYENASGVFTYNAISDRTVQFTPVLTSESYFWDFGDGTTSNLANPSHTFTQDGKYKVCLTQVSNGQSSQNCEYVTVKNISSKACCGQ